MKERLGLWAAFAAGVHFFVVLSFTVMQPHVARAEYAEKGVVLARRYEERGRISEAAKILDTLNEPSYRSSPTAPEAMMEMARFDLRHRNDIGKALAGLDELMTVFPGHPESLTAKTYADLIRAEGGPGSPAISLYFTAVGLSRRGEHSKAIAKIDQLLWQHASDTIIPFALYQGYTISASRLHEPQLANKYLSRLQSAYPGANWRALSSLQ
ncbi:MAG: hypothetical protein AAB229_04475 [Candidatus Hydrogenedentota bacterium]